VIYVEYVAPIKDKTVYKMLVIKAEREISLGDQSIEMIGQ
jgi:hypothetical protein